jgi:beta-glucosidase
MPGPPRWRAPTLISHSLSAQKVSFDDLNARVGTVLRFVQHLAKTSPDVVYGDGEERSRDSPEGRAFCRKLAAAGIVLLKNDGAVLPLKPEGGKPLKVAVVGPNAKGTVISGGGSAALKATYIVSPYQGLVENKPDDVEIEYHVGCYGTPLPLSCFELT